jgi:hypothetical protein
MKDTPKYMLFFDDENQKFVLHLGSYSDCPKNLGLPVINEDCYYFLYLIATHFQRKINGGETFTAANISKLLSTEASKWVRSNGLPIEQWDGTWK